MEREYKSECLEMPECNLTYHGRDAFEIDIRRLLKDVEGIQYVYLYIMVESPTLKSRNNRKG